MAATTLSRTRRTARLRDLMDELLATAWDEDSPASSGLWAPRIDIMETDGAYELRMDLPGLSKDEITINVENHRLTVHGEREEERREDDMNMLRMERHVGRFYRSLPLPEDALPEQAEASFRQGVLAIRLPRTASKKPTRVSIQ